jgi:hypothetical protein
MRKAQGSTSSTPKGKARQHHEAVLTGWEIPAAEALISFVAKHGPSVGAAIYRAWKGKDTLFVQIDASWKTGDCYYVALGFLNLREHGVYLEDIWVSDPKHTPIYMPVDGVLPTGTAFGGGKENIEWVGPNKVLPRLIAAPAETSRPLRLLLRLMDPEEPEKSGTVFSARTAVTLEYKFSQLDQPKPGQKTLMIQLRKHGPAGMPP